MTISASAASRYYVILSKLLELGPMNMLEIGFTASAPTIHNMAKRGLIHVHVEMTERGKEYQDKEMLRRLRSKTKAEKEGRKRVGGLF